MNTARSRGSHSCSVAHVTPFGIFPNLDTIHKVEYYSTPRNLKKNDILELFVGMTTFHVTCTSR